MLTTAPSATAALGGVPASSSADALHHHAWLVLQTGLGHAPRAVLHTIVEEHAHFQARSDDQTFFMARSRLDPVLPRGMQWRTFTNHRSALVKLGLLELVWRAPNQHSDRSRWRIRYDRTISAQPREQLVLPIDEIEAQAPIPDVEAVFAQTFQRENVPNSEEVVVNEPSAERAFLGRQIEQMKVWLANGEERLAQLEARFEALVATDRGRVSEEGPTAVPRAERRRRERRAVKERASLTDVRDSQGAQVVRQALQDPPADSVESAFLQSVSAAMDDLGVNLSDRDKDRFREVEALWATSNDDREVPVHFLPYALRRAEEERPERFVGYVIGVLRNTAQQGYTEDKPPEHLEQRPRERYPHREKRY